MYTNIKNFAFVTLILVALFVASPVLADPVVTPEILCPTVVDSGQRLYGELEGGCVLVDDRNALILHQASPAQMADGLYPYNMWYMGLIDGEWVPLEIHPSDDPIQVHFYQGQPIITKTINGEVFSNAPQDFVDGDGEVQHRDSILTYHVDPPNPHCATTIQTGSQFGGQIEGSCVYLDEHNAILFHQATYEQYEEGAAAYNVWTLGMFEGSQEWDTVQLFPSNDAPMLSFYEGQPVVTVSQEGEIISAIPGFYIDADGQLVEREIDPGIIIEPDTIALGEAIPVPLTPCEGNLPEQAVNMSAEDVIIIIGTCTEGEITFTGEVNGSLLFDVNGERTMTGNVAEHYIVYSESVIYYSFVFGGEIPPNEVLDQLGHDAFFENPISNYDAIVIKVGF